jgi:truncated hemoglobin YjbI
MSEDARSAAARRAAITAQIQADTAIDEAMIERLVRGFYARIRDDAVLGPIFAAKIDDWEPHLQKMCAFWSSVALMSGRYHGQPMAKHLPLPIDARHFDRWLALFNETARDLCRNRPVTAALLEIGEAAKFQALKPTLRSSLKSCRTARSRSSMGGRAAGAGAWKKSCGSWLSRMSLVQRLGPWRRGTMSIRAFCARGAVRCGTGIWLRRRDSTLCQCI